MPIVPITLTMSAITADAVSVPPAPGPSSVISRIASPCSMTALKAPSTLASGCCLSTSAGSTRTSKLPSTSRAAPTSRITMSRSRAALTSAASTVVMPVYVDVGEADARVEGDRREDRHLGGGIRARDVVGRIGLGVTARLRVRECLVVALARLHLGEHEVGRAVDDPEHAVDVRDDERLAQHLDHRDRGADAGLEAQLHAGRRSGREELGPRCAISCLLAETTCLPRFSSSITDDAA